MKTFHWVLTDTNWYAMQGHSGLFYTFGDWLTVYLYLTVY